MKHVLCIVLFVVLTAPFFVPYTFLSYEKYQTKRAVKERLLHEVEKTALVYFKFSKQEVQSVLYWEHETEFEYHNSMYDVVESIPCGDSISFWCWEDSDESILNKQLTALVIAALGANPQHQEKEKVLTHFFKQLYCIFTIENHFFTDYSIDFPLAVPPPEFVKQG